MNRATLIGRLGRDPEVKRLNSGAPVVNLRIATSERWRDKNTGERRENTEWHNVVIFNEGLCKVAEQYLKKGSQVAVEGKIQTRKWKDQSGQDRYTTEIVLGMFGSTLELLGDAGGGSGDREERGGGGRNEYAERTRGDGGGDRAPSYAEELDDEIPF